MPNLNIVQAINLGLKQEMEKDKSVIILGEDVGKDGGVFRVTEGLLERFGEDRIIDTPLSESGIIGVSIGMAAYGLKPVAEIQFDGFMAPAYDQIITHAARIRNRSRGRYSCHITIRAPYGGGIRALEHHSESPEVHFIHTPGLKVVVPATPKDAKGLLISSIRDTDPVIFLEPKKVYRAIKEDVPEEEYTIPIGQAKITRKGQDITLIGWGSMVRLCAQVADSMKGKYSIEVIDMRTLLPFDKETIIESVKKTGRCVIVHEAPRTCGFGAELAAIIQENAFLNLEAPVARLTGYDVVIPLPKLENYYFPDAERISKQIEKAMRF